ncbi:hypothetical protein ACN47E_003432 [Coniothyrium glycines]
MSTNQISFAISIPESAARTDSGQCFASTTFRKNTPPRALLFLDHDPITACEFAAFLPEYFSSHDLVVRYWSNGGDIQALRKMVKYHRTIPKGKDAVTDNALRKLIQNILGEGDCNPSWTTAKHRARQFNTSNQWHEYDYSMTGKQMKCQFPKYPRISNRGCPVCFTWRRCQVFSRSDFR